MPTDLELFNEDARIKDIIITNKKNAEGHILFEEATEWTKNRPIIELLLNHRHIELSDEFIEQICEHYYISDPSYYKLQYNEYFVNTDTDRSCILNTKSLRLEDIVPSKDKILTVDDKRSAFKIPLNGLYYSDTKIVDTVIQALLKTDDTVNKYRRLCYNVLVEQKEEVLIVDNSSYLSSWLMGLMSTIASPKTYFMIASYNTSYYAKYLSDKNKVEFIRFVYIDDTKDLDTKINAVKEAGIKNIIVRGKMSNGEKSKFIQSVKLDLIHLEATDKFIFHMNEMNIFGKPKLLLRNFLKWCCT